MTEVVLKIYMFALLMVLSAQANCYVLFKGGSLRDSIDEARRNGTFVYIPSGEYILNQSLESTGGVDIVGEGRTSILKYVGDGEHALNINSSSIKGVKIVDSMRGNGTISLIRLTGSYSKVIDCNVEDSDGYGIYLDSERNNVSVLDNHIRNSSSHNIYGVNRLKRTAIRGNTIESGGGWGIVIAGEVHAVSIDSNMIVGNKQGGIFVNHVPSAGSSYSWSLRVSKNTLDHNYDDSDLKRKSFSVRLLNASNAVVSDNLVSSSLGYGFFLENVKNSTFTSNSFYKIVSILGIMINMPI